MVGIGKDDGYTNKAILMHEDYSDPVGCVTKMFDYSFKSEVENLKEIKFFLSGGNGGEEYTTKRFEIHKSEILELNNKYQDLINLCQSSDELDSVKEQFEWNESNVFFSTIESTSYLWILHQNMLPKNRTLCGLEVICVNGVELGNEKLALYYKAHILPLLQPSQTCFEKFVWTNLPKCI